MNYQTFKNYQLSINADKLRLDNLNPYALGTSFPVNSNANLNQLDMSKGYHLKQASGVRELLSELLSYFSDLGYHLNIPEDVYPEYFNRAPQNANISSYSSCLRTRFLFHKTNYSLALVANPLIPEGRYLSSTELNELDQWLNEDTNRWLIFDTVYDYKFHSLGFSFKSDRIIYMNSLSKINLNPSKQGWALCKTKLPGFELTQGVKIDYDLACSIQNTYDKAWESINDIFNSKRIHNWIPPEVGYLSLIKKNYMELLEDFDVAAIPASIFGIRKKTLSVISCLSKVNSKIGKPLV